MRILCAFVLFFLTTQSSAIDVRFTSEKSSKVRFSVTVSREEHPFKQVSQNGVRYTEITREEGYNPGLEGQPDLPRFLRYVAVDPAERYDVQFHVSGLTTKNDVILSPVQPLRRERGPKPMFVYDPVSYQADEWLGEKLATAGAPVKIGDVTLLPITLTPYQYNPRQRKLRFVHEITIDVMPINAEPYAPKPLPAFVRSQVNALVVNADAVLSAQPVTASKRLVVVTSEDLVTSAKLLGEFQTDNDSSVDYELVPTGSSSETIRARLAKRYEANPFDSVLIVGDAKRVPLHYFSANLPGDYFYSLLSGNDNLADVSVGRLPARDAAQADILIKRTRRYREMRDKGFQNKKVLLVAHREGYPLKYTANSEMIRNQDNPLGLKYTIQYGGVKATNLSVVAAWNAGFGLVNYRGHGTEDTWLDWGSDGKDFSEPQIRTLDFSEEKTPVIFNIACSTGAIQLSDTMSERFFFPYKYGFTGAVGVLAATMPSYTTVNDRFNLYLFSALQKEADASLGNLVALSNNHLVRDYNGNLPENVKMYLLLSDPLLVPWVR